MTKKSDEPFEHEMFVTEFPKTGFGIVDYLQGRVHFAILDQIKLMTASGMNKTEIKEIILANVSEIVDNFKPKKE